MLLTVVAFIVALAILVAIHEYGHYRMAVACGVKVLRFSVGFGPTIFRWQSKKSATEFVIAALPLGGFVRMLDEREAPVAQEERHLAFSSQPLRARAAIVLAGPMANLLLAIGLYSVIGWVGVNEPQAYIGEPVVGSPAQRAGLHGKDFIRKASFNGAELDPIRSFEDFRWLLTRGALDKKVVYVDVLRESTGESYQLAIDLTRIDTKEADQELFRKIGILGPWTKPEIGDLIPGGAAEKAGLMPKDLVLAVGNTKIVDGQQLREIIRDSVKDQKVVQRDWLIERLGQSIILPVKPDIQNHKNGSVGRINAYIGSPMAMSLIDYGFLDGIVHGFVRTWQVSELTVRMMWRMLTGDASLKNLSGPLTIADYAGRSANMGIVQYLIFLALISVSLGVLNLLPLPVLDGGHLMYYLWEGCTGKPVSSWWMTQLQRGGVALLLLMMLVAFFNDINRLLG